jgi:hypothetical protein
MVKRVIDKQKLITKAQNTMDFTDFELVSDYAKDSVTNLSSIGFVNGFEDKTFKPFAICTRAQAAKIVYGLLGLKGE